MSFMICPANDQLKAFCLGKLPEEQSDELLEHISDCLACQAELETVKDDGDSLIAKLRQPDELAACDLEPACQRSILRALDALSACDGSLLSQTVPKVIGEYEIVRPLGSGGMGHVHLALHTKLGRHVALKVLATNRLGDARAYQRFATEMLAVGRLNHPHVVSAYDAREVDGLAVLVTEFIDGVDLGRLVQRLGPLKIADACEIARQAAIALEYTSQQGFVHRDVKPSNLMLSRHGEVKLLDLGLARLQCDGVSGAEVTGTGQTLGTADYIAPEQVTDSRRVDVRADIYSLGCTLFKLLTGRAPFADDRHATAFAKLTAHVSTAPPNVKTLRGDIPETLSRLLHTMLAKEPDDRLETPADVAQHLSQFADGCDLKELVRAAEQNPATANRHRIDSEKRDTRETWSILNHNVPLSLAIAASMASLLLGVCLGVSITIKYPDGRKVVIDAPSGTEVSVQTQDSSGAPVDKGKTASTSVSETKSKSRLSFSPMSMAVLLNSDTSRDTIARATAVLQASSGSRSVGTDVGTWYPINQRVQARSTVNHNGMDWALASHHPEFVVTWEEVPGNVGATINSGGAHLLFSGKLAEKLTKLSSENLDQDFALILGDRIVYGAKILTSFHRSFDLTDAHLSKEEIRYMSQCLNGGPANLSIPNDDAQGTLSPNAGNSQHSSLMLPKEKSLQTTVTATKSSLAGQPFSTAWAVGRGDLAGTGFSPEEIPSRPELLWSVNLDGAGFEGTPIIADGVVYLASVGGHVVALELANGQVKWKNETKNRFKSPGAYSRERVFFGDDEGNVRAFDAATGKSTWEQKTGGEISAGATFFDDKLLITSHDGVLNCLSQETGAKIWQYKTGDQLQSSPALAGNRAYLAGCDGHLHVVDLTTGRAAAEPIPLKGPTGSAASVSGTSVFVPTHSGTLFAFDITTGKEIWKYADHKSFAEFRHSGAVAAGTVIASSGRQACALEQTTGAVRWQMTLRKRCDSSPIIAGSAVVFAADSCLVILDLKSGRQTSYFEIKGNFLASPASAHGNVVAASDKGTVYCFGTKQPSPLLTPQAALSQYIENFSNGLQALFEAISAARSPANIQVDLDYLAGKLAFVSAKSPRARSEMHNALKQIWPIHGIQSVAKGVPANASWLPTLDQSSYTFSVDYATLLPDVQRFVDSVVGQFGVYSEIVGGVARNPDGSQVDLKRQVIEYLGKEIVVVFDAQPHVMLAFSVSNAQKLQLALERLIAKEPSLACRIIGQYAVIGNIESVESARLRFQSRR